MTVLVKKPNATFIHIPKNAGVAISRWLTMNVHGSYLLDKQHGGKHANQQRIERYVKQKDIDLGFQFCCVRNPWDRVVSAYHYYLRRHNDTNGRHGFTTEEVSWEQFINKEWRDGSWGCVDNQQTSYYKKIDLVLRYENLVREFYYVQKYFEWYMPLTSANSSDRKKDFRTYYTNPEWVDMVAEHYKDDIRTYNYSFE